MIKKKEFVKLVAAIQKQYEFEDRMNDLSREFDCDTYMMGFHSSDYAIAVDSLITYALDVKDPNGKDGWKIDLFWQFICEGSENILVTETATDKVLLNNPTSKELYNYISSNS